MPQCRATAKPVAVNAIVTRWSPQEKRFVWASQPGGKPLAAK